MIYIHLRKYSVASRAHSSRYTGTIESRLSQWKDFSPFRIVVIGGDGSVIYVLNALIRHFAEEQQST